VLHLLGLEMTFKQRIQRIIYKALHSYCTDLQSYKSYVVNSLFYQQGVSLQLKNVILFCSCVSMLLSRRGDHMIVYTLRH
jgi:hypothetical protein